MKKAKIFQRLFIGVIILIALFFMFKIYFVFQGHLKVSTVSTFSTMNDNVFFNMFLSSFSRSANWIFDLFHFNQIRYQAKNLEKENTSLLFQLTQLKNLEEENLVLKEAFNLKKEKGYNLLPAQVVLIDPTGFSGQFWIDQGQSSGLKPGMNVVLSNQVLIGILKECFENYCRGESIFAPQTKIGVEDLKSHVLAILEKDTQGRYLLKLVPQEANILIGDLLITSRENTNFLKGLLVAKVKDIIPSSNVLKEYISELLFAKNQLSTVFVITDFIPSNAAFH
jgi:rod shape-determining protein MreC